MRRLKVSDGKDWTFGEEDIIIDTGTEYSTNVTMNNTYVDTSTISSWSTDSITIGSNPNTTFTISGDDNMLKFDNDIIHRSKIIKHFLDDSENTNRTEKDFKSVYKDELEIIYTTLFKDKGERLLKTGNRNMALYN